MRLDLLTAVAIAGALAHIYFAYQETIGWGPKFVRKAARAWIDANDRNGTEAHIAWARHLAFNVGLYNLVLAAGLAWTAVADPVIRWRLGVFFAFWLIAAAAAAGYTRVYAACIVQGLLGLLLLFASTLAS